MASTPYELRAGLLGQAEGILQHQYHANLENIREKLKLGLIEAEEVDFPSPPTAQDIIAQAELLYAFVQTK
jgi:hypothetical protein